MWYMTWVGAKQDECNRAYCVCMVLQSRWYVTYTMCCHSPSTLCHFASTLHMLSKVCWDKVKCAGQKWNIRCVFRVAGRARDMMLAAAELCISSLACGATDRVLGTGWDA